MLHENDYPQNLIKRLNNYWNTSVMLDFQKNLAFLVAIAAIFGGLLSPVLGFDFASGTSGRDGGSSDEDGSEEDGSEEDGSEEDGSEEDGSEEDGSEEDESDNELQSDPDPCIEDPNAEGCEEDPCLEDPTLEGCEDPCLEDPTLEGCEDPCLEDPTLEGCKPPSDCDPSYPSTCIPSPPPDLDCGEISNRNFKVIGSDPHGFDGENDGIGCEGSNGSVSGGGSSGGSGNNDASSSSTDECQGQADCFRGTVTEIVDGDTIDINNVRVRLALAKTPERGESAYSEAIDFVESVCSIGTRALVDEDDRQKEGSFGRLIGLVYCGESGINNKESLNELLLARGYAVIDQDFCATSEVSSANWAQRYGC
jgi:hypothetical protein